MMSLKVLVTEVNMEERFDFSDDSKIPLNVDLSNEPSEFTEAVFEDTNKEFEGYLLSPHNLAIFESGKLLLNGSIETSREFCKFMVSISTSAIPIYLALLNYSLDAKKHNLLLILVFLAPPLLFLFSTLIFIYGYFPKYFDFSLDYIQDIIKVRKELIRRRKKAALWGCTIFTLGVALGIVIVICAALIK
jgi:hypothetical protein